ncbi:MAG: hypothetical protein K0R09_238 [Clostridiales bacterium]|jgi:hypothetical protein|nr:hypothetical protein [Clostridiales bacterium]
MGYSILPASIYMKNKTKKIINVYRGGFYMKRIGTISAAAGLIYLGTWMIISKVNPELGAEVFKWWPMVIVILGIEVLVQFGRKDGERVGFNFLIVPVLIIMLIANLFNGIKFGFGNWFDNWPVTGGTHISLGGIGFNDSKPINSSKSMPVHGNVLYIHTNNASIDLKESNGGDIRVEGKVYVDKDSFVNKYDITEKKDENGYTIELLDNFIDGVEFDVYIPEGYNVKFLVDNLDLKGNDGFDKSNFYVEADNLNVKLSGTQSIVMDYENGNINIDDTKVINLKGENGNINIRGKSENIDIQADNGKVDVNNEVCKIVNIDLNQGIASVRTNDENVDVKIELSQGVTGINNDKSINSGMSKTFGQGTGKVNIKVHQGTANFRN